MSEQRRIIPEIAELRADARLNPYYLPWTLRGILEDTRLRENQGLMREVDVLRDEFEQWHPTHKVFKDLKFRLEPLRARL